MARSFGPTAGPAPAPGAAPARRVPRRHVAALLLAASLGCGGGDEDGPAGPGGGAVTLEPARAVSAMVGAGGATLTATAASGTSYTLVIPAAALRDSVRITMTPVSAAAGALGAAGLVAGVRFEPEGLVFARGATLTVVLAASANTVRVAAVSAGGDGAAPHVVPAGTEGRTVTVPVTHFSIAGVVTDAQSIPAPPAGAVRQAAEYVIGTALGFLTPTPDAATVQTITSAFRSWFDGSVRPKLQAAAAAAATDATTVLAMSEHDAWFVALIIASIELGTPAGDQLIQVLSPELTEVRQLAAAALREAIRRNNATCLAQGGNLPNALTAAGNALYWQHLADVGLLAGPGSDQYADLGLGPVLEGLCIRVAYDAVQFPEQLTVGQTVPFQVRTGFSVGGAAPSFSDLLEVQVQPAGAAAAGQPLAGPTAADGFFSTQLAIQQNAVVVNVNSCGATTGNFLHLVCHDTLVVRNSGGGRVRLVTNEGSVQACAAAPMGVVGGTACDSSRNARDRLESFSMPASVIKPGSWDDGAGSGQGEANGSLATTIASDTEGLLSIRVQGTATAKANLTGTRGAAGSFSGASVPMIEVTGESVAVEFSGNCTATTSAAGEDASDGAAGTDVRISTIDVIQVHQCDRTTGAQSWTWTGRLEPGVYRLEFTIGASAAAQQEGLGSVTSSSSLSYELKFPR